MAYIAGVEELCQQSGKNLALESTLTKVELYEGTTTSSNDCIAAHISHVCNGKLDPTLVAIVDFQNPHLAVFKAAPRADRESDMCSGSGEQTNGRGERKGKINTKLQNAITSMNPIGHSNGGAASSFHKGSDTHLASSSFSPGVSSMSSAFDLGANDTFRIHRSSKPPRRQKMKRVAVMEFIDPGNMPFSMERLACLMKEGNPTTAVWVWDALTKLMDGRPVCDPGRLGIWSRLLSRKAPTSLSQFSPQSVTDQQLGQFRKDWAEQERKFGAFSNAGSKL